MPLIRSGQTGCKTVSTSAAALLSSKTTMPLYGVKVKAPRSNPGNVHISFAGTITADTTEATAGWILEPGQEDFIPCDNPENIFVRGSSGTNYLYWWLQ